MNILDLVILLLLVLAVFRGARIGALRQVFWLVGIVIGIYLSIFLIPFVAPYVSTNTMKLIVGLALFILFVLAISSIFEAIGNSTSGSLNPSPSISWVNRMLGAVVGFVLIIVSIWLAAAAFRLGPSKYLSRQIQGSLIVRTLDKTLGSNPPQITRIQQFLGDARLPQVFSGPEPQASPLSTSTTTAELGAIAAKDGPSVVKITGFGCGGILEGSGFVAGPGLVVTNAHVVAGVAHPTVRDRNGTHDATPIYFDPDLDVAILRTGNLYGGTLKLNTSSQARGTSAAVLGYPNGGSFTAVSASVLDRVTALGRNIYDTNFVHRSIYILASDVEPGNSGGPLVLNDGSVTGLVFARSQNQSNTGYALTADQISSVLSQVHTNDPSVGTGGCAAD